jgi:AcrR family transcriptional regulator
MGVTERKEREKESRREAIVAAAQKVFFEKGIENTTMRDIAEETELSKATLYLYFTDKEELTFEILLLTFQRVNELIRTAADSHATGYQKLQSISAAYMDFYREYPQYTYFSLVMDQYAHAVAQGKESAQRCMEEIHRIQEFIRELLEEGIRDGSIRSDIEPDKTAVFFIHVVTSFMKRVLVLKDAVGPSMDYRPQELIEHMFTLFLYSLT